MNKFAQTLATIVAITIFCSMVAYAALVQSGSFRYLHQTNQGMAWGTLSLSGEATQSVSTGLTVVESCATTVDTVTSSGTATLHVVCNIPTQTSTNRGKIILNAVGDGTGTGTTKINYVVVGRGGR